MLPRVWHAWHLYLIQASVCHLQTAVPFLTRGRVLTATRPVSGAFDPALTAATAKVPGVACTAGGQVACPRMGHDRATWFGTRCIVPAFFLCSLLRMHRATRCAAFLLELPIAQWRNGVVGGSGAKLCCVVICFFPFVAQQTAGAGPKPYSRATSAARRFHAMLGSDLPNPQAFPEPPAASLGICQTAQGRAPQMGPWRRSTRSTHSVAATRGTMAAQHTPRDHGACAAAAAPPPSRTPPVPSRVQGSSRRYHRPRHVILKHLCGPPACPRAAAQRGAAGRGAARRGSFALLTDAC